MDEAVHNNFEKFRKNVKKSRNLSSRSKILSLIAISDTKFFIDIVNIGLNKVEIY
jgi:hypothetical protein